MSTGHLKTVCWAWLCQLAIFKVSVKIVTVNMSPQPSSYQIFLQNLAMKNLSFQLGHFKVSADLVSVVILLCIYWTSQKCLLNLALQNMPVQLGILTMPAELGSVKYAWSTGGRTWLHLAILIMSAELCLIKYARSNGFLCEFAELRHVKYLNNVCWTWIC